MKKLVFVCLFLLMGIIPGVKAQDGKCKMNLSSDIVSSFIWRGSKIGHGPAIQPTLEFTYGGFTLGSWGSVFFNDEESLETDLYAAYSFDFGLTLGVNDYYFPMTRLFREKSHTLELQGNFQKGKISISANYVLNKSYSANGNDLYFELGYKAGMVNLFAGAGNGWHTPDMEFAVCNVGISSTKDIKITDTFTIPLSGSLVFNPKTEKLFIVVGITL
jgi:hypothetical protein